MRGIVERAEQRRAQEEHRRIVDAEYARRAFEREQAEREHERDLARETLERVQEEFDAREREQEAEPMGETKPNDRACSVPGCGRQDRARPTTYGGIALTIVLCHRHTQAIAGAATEKILRRFLGEQID